MCSSLVQEFQSYQVPIVLRCGSGQILTGSGLRLIRSGFDSQDKTGTDPKLQKKLYPDHAQNNSPIFSLLIFNDQQIFRFSECIADKESDPFQFDYPISPTPPPLQIFSILLKISSDDPQLTFDPKNQSFDNIKKKFEDAFVCKGHEDLTPTDNANYIL